MLQVDRNTECISMKLSTTENWSLNDLIAFKPNSSTNKFNLQISFTLVFLIESASNLIGHFVGL